MSRPPEGPMEHVDKIRLSNILPYVTSTRSGEWAISTTALATLMDLA